MDEICGVKKTRASFGCEKLHPSILLGKGFNTTKNQHILSDYS